MRRSHLLAVVQTTLMRRRDGEGGSPKAHVR
jgi:hypothetical protein